MLHEYSFFHPTFFTRADNWIINFKLIQNSYAALLAIIHNGRFPINIKNLLFHMKYLIALEHDYMISYTIYPHKCLHLVHVCVITAGVLFADWEIWDISMELI